MKNVFFILLFVSIGLFFSACQNKITLPNLSFNTAEGYTYNDITVGQGDSVKIGIMASQGKKNQNLKTLKVLQVLDNQSPTSFLNETLTDAQTTEYSKDMYLVARNQAGTESYTFTIINSEGLENSVSLTLTVQ